MFKKSKLTACALIAGLTLVTSLPADATSHQCLQATEYRGYPCDSPIHGGKYTTNETSSSSGGGSSSSGSVGVAIVLILISLGLFGVVSASKRK